LSGEILNFGTITNSPRHVRIDVVKVLFVQLGKAARVFLSSFDQKPFFGFSCLGQIPPVLAARFLVIKLASREKVTVLFLANV